MKTNDGSTVHGHGKRHGVANGHAHHDGLRAAGAATDAEVKALREKVRRLETYAANVDKQVALLGNELAFANCIKMGIVEPFFTTDNDLVVTHANEGFAALCGVAVAQARHR